MEPKSWTWECSYNLYELWNSYLSAPGGIICDLVTPQKNVATDVSEIAEAVFKRLRRAETDTWIERKERELFFLGRCKPFCSHVPGKYPEDRFTFIFIYEIMQWSQSPRLTGFDRHRHEPVIEIYLLPGNEFFHIITHLLLKHLTSFIEVPMFLRMELKRNNVYRRHSSLYCSVSNHFTSSLHKRLSAFDNSRFCFLCFRS